MGEESEHFRNRAKQCRVLAADVRNNKLDQQALNNMADELDAEAELIEKEEALPKPEDA